MTTEYLVTGLNTFENTQKYCGDYKSQELTATIKAVKTYSKEQTARNIRDVYNCWDAWKRLQPAEFQRRAGIIQDAFEEQLVREYKRHRIPPEGDAAPARGIIIPSAPATAINRWTNVKLGANVGMGLANVGITVAQYATGSAGLGTIAEGALFGTAVAVSATGVGLIAGGLALTVANSVLSLTAAVKSANHRENLIKIYENRKKPPYNEERFCQPVSAGQGPKRRDVCVEHDMIANHVLPYVIHQKDTKFDRKVVASLPIIGMVETVRAAGKYAYKKWTGTQGVNRRNAASWLACHLITCNCLLVQAVVAELYSAGEMEWLKGQPYQAAIHFIERKLKST